jgi:hypothetical protein
MRGVITGKDVLRHSFTIVKVWGLRRYVRCLRAGLSRRPSTFLEVVYELPAQRLSNLRDHASARG